MTADAKSRAYRLKKKEDATAGIRRIALGRAEKAREELLDARANGDPAASIHSARKDLKKLRSAIRLVRSELGEDLFRGENQRYRDAGRMLGQSRDAEVKIKTLEALKERFGDDLPEETSRAWEFVLKNRRDQIAGSQHGRMEAQIVKALCQIDAGDAIPRWPLEDDSWKLVGPGLLRSYKRSRREMKRSHSEPSAEHVHEWRKRVKDLWYQLLIVQNARPPLIRETADHVHELADLLGDHHDLVVLRDDLGDRDSLGDREALEALIGSRQAELLKSAFDIGAGLFAEKPKVFRARFETYWLAWRDQ